MPEKNLYYHPEEFGYELVIDDDFGAAYSPHIIAVFKRLSDGKLFWDSGSACSCYDPMEDCNEESLSPLPETADDFRQELGGNDSEYVESFLIAAGLLTGQVN